jgi:methylphosphotriester-DNA--protein-cysteine methyltransferase
MNCLAACGESVPGGPIVWPAHTLGRCTSIAREHVPQQRDKKLIDVARSVGYESDAAFSKAFKRVVGANPGEYLKRRI